VRPRRLKFLWPLDSMSTAGKASYGQRLEASRSSYGQHIQLDTSRSLHIDQFAVRKKEKKVPVFIPSNFQRTTLSPFTNGDCGSIVCRFLRRPLFQSGVFVFSDFSSHTAFSRKKMALGFSSSDGLSLPPSSAIPSDLPMDCLFLLPLSHPIAQPLLNPTAVSVALTPAPTATARGALRRTRSHGNAYPLPLRPTEHSGMPFSSHQSSIGSAIAPPHQGASRSAMAGVGHVPRTRA
jgi:hypothetical protein